MLKYLVFIFFCSIWENVQNHEYTHNISHPVRHGDKQKCCRKRLIALWTRSPKLLRKYYVVFWSLQMMDIPSLYMPDSPPPPPHPSQWQSSDGFHSTTTTLLFSVKTNYLHPTKATTFAKQWNDLQIPIGESNHPRKIRLGAIGAIRNS